MPNLGNLRLAIKHTWRNRAYTRGAQAYLRDRLTESLGLSEIQLLADHYNRKIYRAQSPEGPQAIKLYLGAQIDKARRQAALYPRLAAGQIIAPDLTYQDTEPAKAKDNQWGGLAMKWIDGKPLDPHDPDQAAGAFANLARLHNIRNDPDPSTEPPQPPLSPKDTLRYVAANLKHLQRALRPSDADQASGVIARMDHAIAQAHAAAPPVGLLHLDYSPANLILASDGALATLDLDNLRYGCFGYDLASALLHFTYGIRSEALGEIEIQDLESETNFAPLLEAYFAQTPTRANWEKHSHTYLEWAYIKAAGNTAFRSRDPIRYPRAERRQLLDRSRQRWEKIIRHAKNSANRPG